MSKFDDYSPFIVMIGIIFVCITILFVSIGPVISQQFATPTEETHTIKSLFSRRHDVMVVDTNGVELSTTYSIASTLEPGKTYKLMVARGSFVTYPEIRWVKYEMMMK